MNFELCARSCRGGTSVITRDSSLCPRHKTSPRPIDWNEARLRCLWFKYNISSYTHEKIPVSHAGYNEEDEECEEEFFHLLFSRTENFAFIKSRLFFSLFCRSFCNSGSLTLPIICSAVPIYLASLDSSSFFSKTSPLPKNTALLPT